MICKNCNGEAEKMEHEVTKELFWVCHNCKKNLGRVCEIYSRIVGYLRPVNQWNESKKEEFKMRKTFLGPDTIITKDKDGNILDNTRR